MPASTPYPQPATRARSRAHPHAVALAIAGTDVSPSASCFPACFEKSWDRGPLESAEQVSEHRTGGGRVWPAPASRPILGKAAAVAAARYVQAMSQLAGMRRTLCSLLCRLC